MKYREIIVEEVYGKFAKVFHRTHTHDNIQAIKQDGFQSGPRAMYGRGIYATYSLLSQLAPYMVEQYGEFIIKSRVNLDGFLILDPSIAKQVYGKKFRLVDQARQFRTTVSDYELADLDQAIEYGERTSTIARRILDRRQIFGMRGIAYTGTRDGRCVVCYEPDTILPMSWTQVSMADIQRLRSQPMPGKAERELAASLSWQSVLNRKLVAKALTSNIDRDLVTKPELIKNIAHPTPEQQLAAVTVNPSLIRFIKQPTVEAQVAATHGEPSVLQYIADPAPEAIVWPLLVTLSVEMVARLKPETIVAALRLSCRILPAVVRANPSKEPTPAQWQAAWHAQDAEAMIAMKGERKQYNADSIPQDALAKLLDRYPAHLHHFKDPSPQIVASAVLAKDQHWGNLALSNCALDRIQVDCSAVPHADLARLVEQQPFLIYAIKDVATDLVAIAMRKDRELARELARNYDLPPELRQLVPKTHKVPAEGSLVV